MVFRSLPEMEFQIVSTICGGSWMGLPEIQWGKYSSRVGIPFRISRDIQSKVAFHCVQGRAARLLILKEPSSQASWVVVHTDKNRYFTCPACHSHVHEPFCTPPTTSSCIKKGGFVPCFRKALYRAQGSKRNWICQWRQVVVRPHWS